MLKWFQTVFFHVSHFKKESEYGQEIPQSHSADQPTAYINMWTQRRDNLWPHGHNLNKKEKNLLDNPTQIIKAISLVVSDKKIFKVFENLFLPMWSRYTISSIIWEGHIRTIPVSQIWLNSSHYFRVRYRLKQLLMTHDGQQTSNDLSLWLRWANIIY